MVDLELIAATAATLLATNVGESFGSELARQAWQRVLAFFSGSASSTNDSLTEALTAAQSAPDDDSKVGELSSALKTRALEDPAFAEQLADLVQWSRQEPATRHILVGGQAKVGKVVSMGDVHGDVTF